MKKKIQKLISIILIIIMLLTLIPAFSYADDEETNAVILEKNDGSKLIYLKGMSNISFKYYFSNSSEEDDEASQVSNTTDNNGENVACLEDETYKYMFVFTEKSENPIIIDLEATSSITEDEIEEVNKLTEKISVDTTGLTTYVTTAEDGTEVTTTLGKILITDDENYTYRYQLIEIVDTNDSVSEINGQALELYEQLALLEDESLTMYEKLIAAITIRDDYEALLEIASWTSATDLTIWQPENSQESEKYVVLIQQLDEDENVVKSDVQFMTCARADNEGVEETETSVTKTVETRTGLPVTGEFIALYIALAVVIIAMIVILIRMKKLKGKVDGKH